MPVKRAIAHWHRFTALDRVAIIAAALLSLACLARGGVDDAVIAVLTLAMLPMVAYLWAQKKPMHHAAATLGATMLLLLTIILVLQIILPNHSLHNAAAWWASLGRLIFFTCIYMLALYIGASESSSRLFLQTLLIGGAACLSFTFFTSTADGIPDSTMHSYRHGFVNANNASAYLGIMLLLALAQAVRLFRFRSLTLSKLVLDSIDQLSMASVIKGCFLLFCLLLTIAGLFMTGSRAGIILALACAASFSVAIILKMKFRLRTREGIILITTLIMGTLLAWSFSNFGQVTINKFATNGISANSRFDIMEGVLPMIADHPLLGTGLGSFASAFQAYRPATVSADGIIDKAHNSYLEFAAEMGLPALIILLAALGWMAMQLIHGIKNRTERYTTPTLGLSVLLLVGLFSLVDFPLQIPGIAAITMALVVIGVSQTDQRFCEPSSSSNAVIKRRRIRKRRRTNPAS